MADQNGSASAQNDLDTRRNWAVDESVNLILSLLSGSEGDMDGERNRRIYGEYELLFDLVESGGRLTRAHRKALHDSRTERYSQMAERIIATSKIPVAIRQERYAQRMMPLTDDLHESYRSEAARRQAELMAQKEDGRIRANGYERRLKRRRQKEPKKIDRSRERKFVRSRRDHDPNL